MTMDEIHKLLDIAEKSLKWPRLKPIHDRAMSMLHMEAASAVPGAAQPLPNNQPPSDPTDTPIEPPDTGTVVRRTINGLPGPAEVE